MPSLAAIIQFCAFEFCLKVAPVFAHVRLQFLLKTEFPWNPHSAAHLDRPISQCHIKYQNSLCHCGQIKAFAQVIK